MNLKSSSRREPLLRPMRPRSWQITRCISSSRRSALQPGSARSRREALNDRKARPNASSISDRGHRAKIMALADQHPQNEASAVFDRAGLPREAVTVWLGCDDALHADYRRSVEKFSRRWRIGAELLISLPPKPARSDAQSAGATAILERDRLARAAFLGIHIEPLYSRLTGDFTKFKRVDDLVRDAAAAVPGLVPDDKQLARENGLQQKDKDGLEIDQGIFLSHVLGDKACGLHLCHAMLLPRAEAAEHSRQFRQDGKIEFAGATLERRGKAAQITMRNPRYLNAEDEATLDGLEIAIDV